MPGQFSDRLEDAAEPFRHGETGVYRDHAMRNMSQPGAGLLDDTPASMAEAGVDAENANRGCHDAHPISGMG